MIKKQWVVALVLLLLIPLVLVLGGMLFSLINPEIAAGHPNYVRNFHLLNLLKKSVMWGTAAVVLVLWLLVCLQVIRAKKRSSSWLVLAPLGPFGLAILAMLSDRETEERDRYARFVRSLNGFVRAGYELCTFMIVWVFAYEGMVLKRTLMIRYEAATTGSSIAQVTDLHNASGGMWAFAEGMEVMYFVVLLYLLRPVIFNFVGRVAETMASPKAS
jgi:hypothetical protein